MTADSISFLLKFIVRLFEAWKRKWFWKYNSRWSHPQGEKDRHQTQPYRFGQRSEKIRLVWTMICPPVRIFGETAMWKEIFAIYGGVRSLEDITKLSLPPPRPSDNSAGCWERIVIVIIIAIIGILLRWWNFCCWLALFRNAGGFLLYPLSCGRNTNGANSIEVQTVYIHWHDGDIADLKKQGFEADSKKCGTNVDFLLEKQ